MSEIRFYIQTILAALGFAIAFLFASSREKNKQLEKEGATKDKIINDIKTANEITEESSKLTKSDLIDRM